MPFDANNLNYTEDQLVEFIRSGVLTLNQAINHRILQANSGAIGRFTPEGMTALINSLVDTARATITTPPPPPPPPAVTPPPGPLPDPMPGQPPGGTGDLPGGAGTFTPLPGPGLPGGGTLSDQMLAGTFQGGVGGQPVIPSAQPGINRTVRQELSLTPQGRSQLLNRFLASPDISGLAPIVQGIAGRRAAGLEPLFTIANLVSQAAGGEPGNFFNFLGSQESVPNQTTFRNALLPLLQLLDVPGPGEEGFDLSPSQQAVRGSLLANEGGIAGDVLFGTALANIAPLFRPAAARALSQQVQRFRGANESLPLIQEVARGLTGQGTFASAFR